MAFAHQEMVSQPQSRLTDLPRTESFLSLPFRPPHAPPGHLSPQRVLSPQWVPWESGRLTAPGEWRRQHSCSGPGPGRLALLAGGEREGWGQHGGFPRQVSCVHVIPLLQTSRGGPAVRSKVLAQSHSGVLPPGPRELRPGLGFCLLKPIGKVHEIAAQRAASARGRGVCCPLPKLWPPLGRLPWAPPVNRNRSPPCGAAGLRLVWAPLPRCPRATDGRTVHVLFQGASVWTQLGPTLPNTW